MQDVIHEKVKMLRKNATSRMQNDRNQIHLANQEKWMTSLNLRSLITSRILAQNILIECEKSAGKNQGMRKNRIAPICDLSNEKVAT